MPVELRVLDCRDGAVISDASHALVRDVSAGGARLELLESAAGTLSDFRNGVGYLQLKLVTPDLAHKAPIPAHLRWARQLSGDSGWAIGVAFGGDAGSQPYHWLVEALEPRRMRSKNRSTAAIVLLSAALVLVAAPGLYILGASSGARRSTAAGDVTPPSRQREHTSYEEIDYLLRRLDRSSKSIATLQQELQSCRNDLNLQPVELGALPPTPTPPALGAAAIAEQTDQKPEANRHSSKSVPAPSASTQTAAPTDAINSSY